MRLFSPSLCLLAVSCTSPYPTSTPDFKSLTISKDLYLKSSNPSYAQVVELIRTTGNDVSDKMVKLSNQKNILGDVGMLGSITAVIAAASGAVTTALYGGGVALGSGAASQRYNYDIQLLNYQVTKEKINCMYRSVTELTASQYNIIIDDNSKNHRIALALLPYTHGILNDLIFELQTQQAAVTLVTPDLTALTSLLDKKRKADQPVIKGSNGGKSVYLSKITGAKGTKGYPSEYKEINSNIVYDSLADLIMSNIGLCKLSPQGRNLSISNDTASQPKT
ncbi:hypothetical protein AAEK27_004626 [Klebsiella quasipneumoniae]